MKAYAISALINTILASLLGLIVYRKNARNKLNRKYAAFCFFVAVWSYGYFFWQISDTAVSALFWCRVLTAGSIFIPLSFLYFILSFLEIYHKKQIIVKFGKIFFSLIFFLNFTPLIVKDVSSKLSFKFWPEPGILYTPYLFVWLFYCLYPCYLLFRKYGKSTGIKRNQIKYLLLSISIGYTGGATNYFLWYDIPIPPVGNFLVPLFVGLMAYVIIKHHLMDIRVFVSKAVAFLISYPIFLGIPFFFAYRLRPYFYGLWGTNWWLAPSGLLVFFATLSPLAYSQLRSKMENKLLAEQKRYQQILLQAASGMVREHNLKKLAKLIAYILKRSVKIKFSAVFLHNKKENIYSLEAVRDSRFFPKSDITFLSEHPFIQYLTKTKTPVLYEEVPADLRRTLHFPVDINLIVPSVMEGDLLGFVLLGEKKSRQPYTPQDINVFKILANQAALAIANCLFLEEFKKAQEKIFTAEKLASVGGMADGVAHQIKNRLNQFSVASGELQFEIKDVIKNNPDVISNNPKLKESLDYMASIGKSLVSNVKKTDAIVRGILEFARVEEKETFFSQFSLKEVVKLSTELLKVKHEIAKAPVKVKIPKDDALYGVKSQILEGVYNFLDNAYEATQEKRNLLNQEEGYQEKIEVKLVQNTHSSQIQISDNGIGVRHQDKDKIFAPFFTTKSSYKSGTGIGLYVVKRMVEENHKGKVWFNSTHMEGTDFFIEIPQKK